MNPILQKRIEETAQKELEDTLEVTMSCQCANIAYEEFLQGAKYALTHQWISVEEALPEEYIHCFVAYKAMDSVLYSTGNYYEDNEEWYVDGYGFDAEVTHWMSVPQLKGGEK